MPWGLSEFDKEPTLTETGRGGGRRGIRNTQWETCLRCGRLTPTGEMVYQKGLRICNRKGCFDNLEVERRAVEIINILNAGVEEEGIDTRELEGTLFDSFEEGIG